MRMHICKCIQHNYTNKQLYLCTQPYAYIQTHIHANIHIRESLYRKNGIVGELDWLACWFEFDWFDIKSLIVGSV